MKKIIAKVILIAMVSCYMVALVYRYGLIDAAIGTIVTLSLASLFAWCIYQICK